METLYRRPLPADAIAFSSLEGRQIFAEALATGGLDGYFPLAEQFHTQSDPSLCGLESLVVALNALAIDPGRLRKGPWAVTDLGSVACAAPFASHLELRIPSAAAHQEALAKTRAALRSAPHYASIVDAIGPERPKWLPCCCSQSSSCSRPRVAARSVR